MSFFSLGPYPKIPLTVQDINSETKAIPPLYVLVSNSKMTSLVGYFVLVDLGMYYIFVLNVNIFMYVKSRKWQAMYDKKNDVCGCTLAMNFGSEWAHC